MTQSGDNDSPATTKEPEPTGYGVVVLDLVLTDLKERSAKGEEKYGRPLHTNNGRRPLVDAYQEVLDLAMYLRQELEERRDVSAVLGALAAVRAENARLLEANAYLGERLERLHDENACLTEANAALGLRVLDRETSKSIAAWQVDTFGAATTTRERIARSSIAMHRALLDASMLDLSTRRPNLSRAIRAAEELAELIGVLCHDDNDGRAPEEATDVDIVLSGILAYHGKELIHERDRKMAINRRRKWATTGDGHGQHVLSQHEEAGDGGH